MIYLIYLSDLWKGVEADDDYSEAARGAGKGDLSDTPDASRARHADTRTAARSSC